jgi:hypothetical protein
VGLWREFVKAGALSLQQAVWAQPAGRSTDTLIERVRHLVDRAEGQLFVYEIAPKGDEAATLERLYTEAREAEWGEFLAECDKFDAEIDKEFAKKKFTLAELDEEEHNLGGLRQWFDEIAARDSFGAPSAARAEQRVKEATESLERFADAVFAAGQDA